MARVLGRVRLSRVTDATTSPERQRAIIEQWATAHGHEVIDWATDLDVSRSVNPLEAPGLGPWLSDRSEQFDIIATWKLDRLATGSIYLSKVMEWAQTNGKSIVSVTESFDLNTWVGRMVANLLAGVAEGELEAIRARNYSAAQYNIKAGKYRGSTPPVGYVGKKIDGQWRYVHDPVMAPIVQEIIDRVISGESLRSIRLDLIDRGIPSPQAHGRILRDKAPGSTEWRINAMKRFLQSPALLGQVVYREAETDASGQFIRDSMGKKKYGQEQILRDESGAPVVRAEPLIDRKKFDELQEALKNKNFAPKRRKNPVSPLLQVIFCGVCGRPCYRQRGRHFDYWRCASAQYRENCGNNGWRLEEAEELVEERLLTDFGHLEMKRRVFVPGDDTATELAEVEAELNDIAALVGTPAFRGKARDTLMARIEALSARRDELEARPVQEPGYRFEPTGETFSEHYNGLDNEGKNKFLRDNKVRLTYTKSNGVVLPHLETLYLDRLLRAIDPEIELNIN